LGIVTSGSRRWHETLRILPTVRYLNNLQAPCSLAYRGLHKLDGITGLPVRIIGCVSTLQPPRSTFRSVAPAPLPLPLCHAPATLLTVSSVSRRFGRNHLHCQVYYLNTAGVPNIRRYCHSSLDSLASGGFDSRLSHARLLRVCWTTRNTHTTIPVLPTNHIHQKKHTQQYYKLYISFMYTYMFRRQGAILRESQIQTSARTNP
jgi:hypothetical protein